MADAGAWRSSWRRTAITVNAVAPGHIATPMTGKAGVDPHSVALPPIPLGRPGGPDEVAAMIAHLVSRRRGYVTGSSFVVDGGLLLTAALPLQRVVEGGTARGRTADRPAPTALASAARAPGRAGADPRRCSSW